MDNYTEIRNKIRAMTGQKTPLLLTGKVESVDSDRCTCTVNVGGLKLTDVRLRSVVNGESSRLLITPAKDSHVTLIDLSGELRETEVIGYSQIKAIDIQGTDADPVEVTINGGKNQGLVKIRELENNLEEIKNYLIALKTAIKTGLGATHPAASAAAVEAFDIAMAAKDINFRDMENDRVKH